MTLNDVLKILKTCSDNIDNSHELYRGFCSLPTTDKKKVLSRLNTLNSTTLLNFLNHSEVLNYMSLGQINFLLSTVDDKALLSLIFRPIFYQNIVCLANKLDSSVAVCYINEIYRSSKNIDAFLKFNYVINYLDKNVSLALAIQAKSKNIIQLVMNKDSEVINFNYIFTVLSSMVDRTINEKNHIDNKKRQYVLFVLSKICPDDEINIYNFISQINDPLLIIMILDYYNISLNSITPKLAKKIINNLRFLSNLKDIDFNTIKTIIRNLSNDEIFDYICQPKFINVLGYKNILDLLKLLPKDYYEDFVETIVDNPVFDEALFNECFKYLSHDSRIKFLSYEKVILNLDVSMIINHLEKYSLDDRKRLLKLVINASHNCLDKQLIILYEYANKFEASVDDIYENIISNQDVYPKDIQLNDIVPVIVRKYENKIINASDDNNYPFLIGYLGKKNMNGEGLFFKLLGKDYCDKEISKSYYQIVILRILYYLISNNLTCNTHGYFSSLKKEDTGASTSTNNSSSIELNLQNVGTTFRSNLPLFEACFHEICHCHRHECINAGQVDYSNLVVSLEDALEKYGNHKLESNTWSCAEIEAFSESIHKLHQLLSSYNDQLASYYLNQSKDILSVVKKQLALSKKSNSINSYNELEEQFERLIDDNILNKELIQRIFSEYPVIRYIFNFNKNGSITLKSINEIIEIIISTNDNQMKELIRQIFESRLKQIDYLKNKKILSRYYQEIERLISNSDNPDFDELRQRLVQTIAHDNSTDIKYAI